MDRPERHEAKPLRVLRIEEIKDAIATLRWQGRTHRRLLLLVVVSVLVVLLPLVIVQATTDVAIGDLTRDPLVDTDLPVYKGAVSNLGVLIWMASASVCLFTYALLRTSQTLGRDASFFLAAGVLTLVLVVDDLFMVHEVVLPDLRVPEKLVMAAYGGALFWFLVRFRQSLLNRYSLFLVLALGGFALSVVLDMTPSRFAISTSYRYLIEDGAKLLGIVSWTVYFVVVCMQAVLAEFSGKRHTA